jgi:protein-S-isoprenylcysteine O-methyltransferase Ste14
LNVLDHWSHLAFLVGFFVYMRTRHAFEARFKGTESLERRVDRVELVTLVAVSLGAGVLPLLFLFSPWLAFADVSLPLWCEVLGAASMLAGLWLFWRSHADLGRQWSVTLELRKDHQLVTRGVYRRVRHPMYTAILLVGAAQGLMLHNALAGWSGMATLSVLIALRLPKEEAMLVDQFGQDYRDYTARTGRLLPRLGGGQ